MPSSGNITFSGWVMTGFAAVVLALFIVTAFSSRRFSDDVTRLLVDAHPDQPRVAKLVVGGPLHERHLDHDRRLDPMRAQARQALRDRERRLLDFDRIEALAEVEEQPGVEAGPDLSRED